MKRINHNKLTVKDKQLKSERRPRFVYKSTQAQKKLMRQLGIKHDKNTTKYEAMDLIEKALRVKGSRSCKVKLATSEQFQEMMKLGLPHDNTTSFESARIRIKNHYDKLELKEKLK